MAEKPCRINVYTSADKIAWHHASFSFLQNRKFLIKLFHSVTVLTLPRRVLIFSKGEPYFPLKSPVPNSNTVKAGQGYPPRFYYSCSRNLVPNSKRHFCMRNEQRIFYENFSVFGQIENLRMNNIALKTFTSNSEKRSW